MALDLSTVSETTYKEVESQSSRFVLLPVEGITITGTSDVLFRVTEDGNLLLAQFFMESINGTDIIRRRSYPLAVYGSQVDDTSSEAATNLRIGNLISDQRQTSRTTNGPNTAHFEDLGTCASNRWLCETDDEPFDATVLAPCVTQQTDQTIFANDNGESVQHQQNSDIDDCSAITKSPANLLSVIACKLLEQQSCSTQTANSIKGDVVISGHNLSELSRFVNRLREFRHTVGLSQIQLSDELSRHFRNESLFSQPLLSRFEKLNITVRAAFRLLPYLRAWLSHAEKRQCNFNGLEPNLLGMSYSAAVNYPAALSGLPSVNTGTVATLPSRPIRTVGRARLSALAARMVHPAELNTGQPSVGMDHQHGHYYQQFSSEKNALPTALVDNTSNLTASSHSVGCKPPSAVGAVEHQHQEPTALNGDYSHELPSTANSCQLSVVESNRPWRRKRTRFTPATLATLAAAFSNSPHPSSAQLTRLATETGHTRESIRVWFGNRRQLTNQAKPVRQKVTS